jgi:ABC-type transport system involved in cytochrome bd biosynthesis fused ATPase/permease subunit
LERIKGEIEFKLVGASGSGKTTLVKLLLKYYLPEKGEILIDSYNILDIESESLRNRIGYVPSITEKMFQETLDFISQKITTVIIAHRLSTIRRCDRIVVMEKGSIVESGTHTELINRKGQYYGLWQSQVGENFPFGSKGRFPKPDFMIKKGSRPKLKSECYVRLELLRNARNYSTLCWKSWTCDKIGSLFSPHS